MQVNDYVFYEPAGLCRVVEMSEDSNGYSYRVKLKSEFDSTQYAVDSESVEIRIPTDEQVREEKWRLRLLGVCEEEQKRIAAKYYGGHMPWRERKASR